ncbi:hypothetical protein Pth03_36440 [Planotetraspora thailandica]|uniref:Uncharacterized protein n=1 Tax=Planotetraspora thailandica TaxID=487172 RepID=A0A8J3V325_9ACTN|nr:hypothetical protein Pth03_36440 [Planotetraspora thailandica]
MRVVALLEAQVVVDADACEHGEFFTPQADGPATPKVGQTDVFGTHQLASRAEILPDVAAGIHGNDDTYAQAF